MTPMQLEVEGDTPIERLSIVLLNVTGAVHNLIQAEGGTPGEPSEDGIEIIDRVAKRLQPFVEENFDIFGPNAVDELTQRLASLTISLAESGGFDDVFYEPAVVAIVVPEERPR